MPWGRFLVGDAVGALVQAALFTYGARKLGWQWATLRAPFDHVDDLLTGVLVIALLVALWRKRRR